MQRDPTGPFTVSKVVDDGLLVFWLVIPGETGHHAAGPFHNEYDLLSPLLPHEAPFDPHYEGLLRAALAAAGHDRVELCTLDLTPLFAALRGRFLGPLDRPKHPSLQRIEGLWREAKNSDRVLRWIVDTRPELLLEESDEYRPLLHDPAALASFAEDLAREFAPEKPNF